MARKRTGSTGGRGAAPGDEAVAAPRGYSIYSEKAEQAAAARDDAAQAGDAAARDDAAADVAARDDAAADVAARDDAALLSSVDAAVASGGTEPVEPAEPPAPGYSIFAEAEAPKTPMTPEEAAREAAEDAEIIAAVEDAVGKTPARTPAETPIDAPAETTAEAISEASAETVEPAREPEELGYRREPDVTPVSEPDVVSRPAPDPEPAPRYSREPETASIPPAAVAAASARSGGASGKILGGLVLLLAGGALALWLGPKVAPSLPSGMAPVAKFLEPGRDAAEARFGALDSEIAALKAQVANMPTGVTPDQVSTAVSGVKTEVDGALTQLRDQIGAGAQVPERLARLESASEGVAAEMTTLKDQIAAAGPTGAAAPAPDLYRGEIDGLRAEMGTLSDQVATLGSRVDEVDAAAQRQIQTAQATVDTVQEEATQAVDTATRQADVAAVGAALAAGQPFAEPLSRLAAIPDTAVPAGLTAAAASGVPSLATLRDSFPEAAHAAIRASIVAGAGDGTVDRAFAMLRSQFATRSLTPREGGAPDAILSRMTQKIGQDDLTGALAEANALPSEAQAAMGGWLAQAKLRADADAGLAELESATPATN